MYELTHELTVATNPFASPMFEAAPSNSAGEWNHPLLRWWTLPAVLLGVPAMGLLMLSLLGNVLLARQMVLAATQNDFRGFAELAQPHIATLAVLGLNGCVLLAGSLAWWQERLRLAVVLSFAGGSLIPALAFLAGL